MIAALFVDRRGPYWNRPDVDAWDETRDARKWGGVLEHPEASHAFKKFGLPVPLKMGGWVLSRDGEWTCCVEQGHYGHLARKATWLCYVGDSPPNPIWGPSSGVRLDEGFHSKAERDAARASGQKPVKRLSTVQNIVTPPAFAELLISLARSARVQSEAA